MNPSSQRIRRWASRGALILATLAISLGTIFTLLIALASQTLPADAPGLLALFARSLLLWGAGGLFFGAILGAYAAMIWPDRDV